jgi:hypothetical protein
MIAWILTNWITQIAVLAFCVWFLNGLRKALLNPSLQYVSHINVGERGALIKIQRQQLLPPWRTLDESWLLRSDCATREGDGRTLLSPRLSTSLRDDRLYNSIAGCLRVAMAREAAKDAELAELEKQLAEERRLSETISKAEVRS